MVSTLTPPSGFLAAFKSYSPAVVADRAFNGKKIAQAYLGDDNVYRVKVDPDNPNQQITFLKGDRKLISKITARGREIPTDNRFIATEVTQQLFRSPERLYLNEVETTSSYELLDPEQHKRRTDYSNLSFSPRSRLFLRRRSPRRTLSLSPSSEQARIVTNSLSILITYYF